MKKYIFTAFALLMAATMFVGCGCANRNVSDNPAGMITDPTSIPATTNPMPTMTTPSEESTRPSTVPHTETTMPSRPMDPSIGTEHTTPTDHTGATGSVTDSTDGTHSDNARIRNHWPDRHS